MATAKTFEITPENTGLWHVKQSELAAKKTSELLQKDLEVSLSLGPLTQLFFMDLLFYFIRKQRFTLTK